LMMNSSRGPTAVFIQKQLKFSWFLLIFASLNFAIKYEIFTLYWIFHHVEITWIKKGTIRIFASRWFQVLFCWVRCSLTCGFLSAILWFNRSIVLRGTSSLFFVIFVEKKRENYGLNFWLIIRIIGILGIIIFGIKLRFPIIIHGFLAIFLFSPKPRREKNCHKFHYSKCFEKT
jgi:hypothetical protein